MVQFGNERWEYFVLFIGYEIKNGEEQHSAEEKNYENMVFLSADSFFPGIIWVCQHVQL